MFKEPNPEQFGIPTLYMDEFGNKYWHLNGELHREDGPAIEELDGSCSWHLNGKLHREDGPAVIYPNGTKGWYINGMYFTEEEFWQEVKSYV